MSNRVRFNKRILLVFLATSLATPTMAFAAGSSDSSSQPPKSTNTTKACPQGTVYNIFTRTCVKIRESNLDADNLYEAARELAYFGRYEDALAVLDEMPDQSDDRVKTYRGFIARKNGDFNLAMQYYQDAIAANPDNLLARSYMGQGLVSVGDKALARRQLKEIRARGGEGGWPERSLAMAIESGVTFNY